MVANFEARKLDMVKHLADLTEEHILIQIENLLKPESDFWDELSIQDQQNIEEGLTQLKQGKKIAYEDFLAKYK